MICESCKAEFLKMLDQRITAILRVHQEEGTDGGAHCFHLMELQRKLEGKPIASTYEG
jgi:hypothetical protein